MDANVVKDCESKAAVTAWGKRIMDDDNECEHIVNAAETLMNQCTAQLQYLVKSHG
jgi:hypothetical protein